MTKTIGIDLGTLYSSVSSFIDHKANIILNNEGYNLTPSYIAYSNNNLLVGEQAKKQFLMNPSLTYTFFANYHPLLEKTLIKKLIDDASYQLNTHIRTINLSLPSHFEQSKYNEIKDLCKDMDIEIKHYVNKTDAIALTYAQDHYNDLIMIIHLDELYYEVSIYDIDHNQIELLAYTHNELKGLDIYKEVTYYLIDQFKQEHDVDLSHDQVALTRIYDALRQSIKDLNTTTSSRILLPYITINKYGPLNLDVILTRQKFNQICLNLLSKLDEPIYNALNEARLLPSELDKILLIGESTRIPLIQERIKELTGLIPSLSMNHKEYFSIGTALYSSDSIKNINHR